MEVDSSTDAFLYYTIMSMAVHVCPSLDGISPYTKLAERRSCCRMFQLPRSSGRIRRFRYVFQYRDGASQLDSLIDKLCTVVLSP